MVSETQNAQSELTSYNKRCIIFSNLLNLFLSWCVILLIVCGLCFMVSKQYFYLVIGSIILSLSIRDNVLVKACHSVWTNFLKVSMKYDCINFENKLRGSPTPQNQPVLFCPRGFNAVS